MQKRVPQKISNILTNSSPELSSILRQTHVLNTLNTILNQLLPEPSKNHCHIANVREQIIILHTDSPAWATRIRYEIPRILKQINEMYNKQVFLEIKLKVRASYIQTTANDTQSTKQKETLKKRPASDIKDPKLKQAMDRLLHHRKA